MLAETTKQDQTNLAWRGVHFPSSTKRVPKNHTRFHLAQHKEMPTTREHPGYTTFAHFAILRIRLFHSLGRRRIEPR
jgi:hypothetical protein